MTPTWPDDAATLIAWANGQPVDVDMLVCDLEWWSNYFGPTAALWPDATAQRGTVRTGGDV